MAEKDTGAAATPPPVEAAPAIGFFQLFRFYTRYELCLNVLGAIAATIAGVSQPLMSILLGSLAQSFVNFSSALAAYNQDPSSPSADQQLHIAAAQFRASASKSSLYLVAIGIGVFAVTCIYMTTWIYTAGRNAARIREKYLRALLRQEIAYFDSVSPGEVATRIQSDTHLVQQGLSDKVPMVLYMLASFVSGFVIAYARSWRIALVMSCTIPCIGLAGTFMVKFMTKYIQLSLNHVADGGSVAEEAISTIRTAHAFGTQRALSSRYRNHAHAARVLDTKAAVFQGVGLGVFFFVSYSSYALAFFYGTMLINEGHATAGEVVSVIAAILVGSFSLTSVGPDLQVVARGQAAAAKLFATIDRTPDIDSSDPAGLKPPQVVGEITLEDVKFNYPSRPDVPIVKGINITFAAGKTAALVGASGSGKSTIISLIERFYDPLSGSVKLDGVDVRNLNLKWLRSQIGLVSQEPTLFATSIRGNVAHGLINTPYEDASDQEKFKLIKEACVKANADGFINKLPNGYDTMVGERGFLLSGGQKQRVAIARAIASDPRILLLDEATSALDTQSEDIVQDALDKAAAGRTTITIAHRLSTVKDADCIYVMSDGLVLEMGKHAELLADENSAYSRLVQAQKLKEMVVDHGSGDAVEESKTAEEVIPLVRLGTSQSIASSLVRKRHVEKQKQEVDYHGVLYAFMRIGLLDRGALWMYAIGSLCALVTGVTYPLFSIVYAMTISGFSAVSDSARQADGDRNALWFFIIAIATGFTAAGQYYYFSSGAAAVVSELRSRNFKAILRQDVEYFDKEEHNTGFLTANLSENAQRISSLVGATLGGFVQSISTVVSALIIGFVYAWKPALVGMACAPITFLTGYVRLRVVRLRDERTKKSYEDSAQIACEAAASIRTVASLTREEDCIRLYTERLEEPLKKLNGGIWGSLLYAFTQSTTFYIVALLFWYGSGLVADLEISTTAFYTTLMGIIFGTMQAATIMSYAPDVAAASSAAVQIVQLLESVPEIDTDSTAGKTFEGETVRGQVILENVHFRYPARPGIRVLRDLSIKIEPGTYIALVGASGCGKSTVIQLIERFYDPLAGHVLLDGKPIHEFNVQEYRKQIALVSQEPTLYSGTIRFNILFGATKPESEVTQEEIGAACRNANIWDFIQSLPDGFDTQVGGKGSQLSGGQKQRIAIARALLRNPRVLLLDEATSALDSNSEKVVQDALDNAAKGRTTIAIAHRLSTIQNADCIYFIKEGRVSEAGTHDELLSLRGDYYEYVQLQTLTR